MNEQIPAELATLILNLCRAVGDQDVQGQKDMVWKIGEYFSRRGDEQLAEYCYAQVCPSMAWVPM
jgi:hypothetical protein